MIKAFREYTSVLSNEFNTYFGVALGIVLGIFVPRILRHYQPTELSSPWLFWSLWYAGAIALGLGVRLVSAFLMRKFSKVPKLSLKKKKAREMETKAWSKYKWGLMIYSAMMLAVVALEDSRVFPGFFGETFLLGMFFSLLVWMAFFMPRNIFSLKKGSAASKINKGSFVLLKIEVVLLLGFIVWRITR